MPEKKNSANNGYFTVEAHEGLFPEFITSQSLKSEGREKLDLSSLHMLVYYYVQQVSYENAFEILEWIVEHGKETLLTYIYIWKFFIYIRTRNLREAQSIKEKINIKNTMLEFFQLIYHTADAKLLFFENNINESEIAFKSLDEGSNISNYKYLHGYLLNQFGQVEDVLGRKQQAIKYFKGALVIFSQINNDKQLLSACNNLGVCYQENEEYQLALKYFEKARKLNDKDYREFVDAILNTNFGVVYMQIGMLQKSEIAFKKSLKFFETNNMNPLVIKMCQNLGSLYGISGEYETSIMYSKRAVDLLNIEENIVDRANIVLNIAKGLCYQKKFQKAEDTIREIEEVLEDKNLVILTNNMLSTYIDLYLAKGERIKAKPYYDELQKNLEDTSIHLKNKSGFEYTIADYNLESPRFQEKAEGMKLLNKIIDSETTLYEIYTLALIKKCHVLLDEYKKTKLEDIITEIDHSLQKLMNFANQGNRVIIIIQSLLLMTEFELLKGNIKLAHEFFVKAKNLVSENQIDIYTIFIDAIQEELLNLVGSDDSEVVNISQIKDTGLKNMSNLLNTLLSGKVNFVSKWSDPETDKFLNAVLHPIRYKIVKVLATEGKMLRTELQKSIDISQSSISRHLKTLETESIVISNFEFIDSKAQSIVEITPYGVHQLKIFEES